MHKAHSLDSIHQTLSLELPRTIVATKQEPVIEIGFASTLDMDRPLRYQSVQVEEERNTKLVGILFSHPATKLAKSEIIDHLPHFHLRSGDAMDLFCVGYGEDWPSEHFVDQTPVVQIDGVDWLFSEQAFSDVIDQLECETQWKYSGETELILVTAIKDALGNIALDYSCAIVCNLETMAMDKAFSSVRAFFTDLFRYAKSHSDSDSTWGLSDNEGISVGKFFLKEAILSLLPKALKDSYIKAEHYAVRNITA